MNRLSRSKACTEVLDLRSPRSWSTSLRPTVAPTVKLGLGGAALIGQFAGRLSGRRNTVGAGVGGSGSVREDLNGTDTTNRVKVSAEMRLVRMVVIGKTPKSED